MRHCECALLAPTITIAVGAVTIVYDIYPRAASYQLTCPKLELKVKFFGPQNNAHKVGRFTR